MMGIQGIAVIGAGLMGHGIAQVFASAGHPVSIYDREVATLEMVPARVKEIFEILEEDPAPGGNITLHEEIETAIDGATIVIEAIAENLALKQQLFKNLEPLIDKSVILASNTSALPITDIAEFCDHKERVLGTHFWNPPHFIPLVEVVQTEYTDYKYIEQTINLLEAADLSAVHVKKDIPGFIGNRLQHALKREAISLVADGICDAETLDRVVKEGFGARLGVLGPLEQADMIGLNLTLDCHKTLIQHLDRTPHEHPFLLEKIAAGEKGMVDGKGFRSWTEAEAQELRSKFNNHMAKRARERRK
ncbi:MAG: 3-hydroxyacyl-CoA dehydrogenase family protein, partial [Rhodospirillaceae bacterium]|nr:3-hydroxyacyl-CoA dehydrogenase family protein [Rhodospirillaceae bacterium]